MPRHPQAAPTPASDRLFARWLRAWRKRHPADARTDAELRAVYGTEGGWSAIEEPRRHPPLTPAQQELALTCKGFAHRLARQYERLLGPEDAEGIALLELSKAAAFFDPSRGWQFTTYAGTAIKRALWKAVERVKRQMALRPTYQMLDYDCPEPAPGEPAAEVAEELGLCLRGLSEREVEVLRRWAEGEKLGDIGASMGGVSKEWVRQVRERAIGKVRRTRKVK